MVYSSYFNVYCYTNASFFICTMYHVYIDHGGLVWERNKRVYHNPIHMFASNVQNSYSQQNTLYTNTRINYREREWSLWVIPGVNASTILTSQRQTTQLLDVHINTGESCKSEKKPLAQSISQVGLQSTSSIKCIQPSPDTMLHQPIALD